MKRNKKIDKAVVSVIALLLLVFGVVLYINTDPTPKNPSVQQPESQAEALDRDASLADLASELCDMAYNLARLTNRFTRVPLVRIPVLADRNGGYWVDQYGDVIPNEQVVSFFISNPEIKQEILYLNQISWLTPALQGEGRNSRLAMLETECELKKSGCIESEDTEVILDNRALDLAYLIILSNLDAEQIKKYNAFVDLSGFESTVKEIGDEKENFPAVNPKNGISYRVEKIFLCSLMNFGENGIYTDLCTGWDEDVSPMPVVLWNDGVWYDQFANPMADDTVSEFFNQNPVYATEIAKMNEFCNPFIYLKTNGNDAEDSWFNWVGDYALHYVSTRPTTADDELDFADAINEIAMNPVEQKYVNILLTEVCNAEGFSDIIGLMSSFNDPKPNPPIGTSRYYHQKEETFESFVETLYELSSCNGLNSTIKTFGFEPDNEVEFLYSGALTRVVEKHYDGGQKNPPVDNPIQSH